MFEQFTDRARQVVVLAQEHAREENHSFVSTDDLLLGLIGEGEGVAAKALESLGVSRAAVGQQVDELLGQHYDAPLEQMQFTPRAKTVLELAQQESRALGHDHIGTAHVLLGLTREDGVAAQVLARLGVDMDRVRQQVIQLLPGCQG